MRGLLGKKLSHSYSKVVHEKIDGIEYNLIEVDDLDSFFRENNFEALNVTIPYKYDVIKYLDSIEESAALIESVNTIVRRDGLLKGYNTDIDGLIFLLEYYHINIQNVVVGILGNGATSRTIKFVCETLGAKEVKVFARKPKVTEHNLQDTSEFSTIEVLFNSTPVGMYPHVDDQLIIDILSFPHLSVLIDLIYNPLRTRLMISAQDNGIRAVNGLMMLIHQAVKANEYFNNVVHSKAKTIEIYNNILLNKINIVLIGMPMSGKSYYSRAVSNLYQKDLVDIDLLIEETSSKSIPEIFNDLGESLFRKLETDTIKKVSISHNLAISTGGGVILNKENIDYLRQNGIIIFLDMPLSELKKCNPKNRPLLKDPKNIEKLYNDRYPLYYKYCDKRVVKRGFKRQETLESIEVKINEYINS